MSKKRLKGLFSVVVAGTMFMGLSLSAFAADGTASTTPTGGNATVTNEGGDWKILNDDDDKALATDDDQSQIGVYAKVNISGASVYKVDIGWGQMKFTYTNSKRVWNPTTHSYGDDNEGTVGWNVAEIDGANNKITIVNHSNAGITAGLAYAHNLTETASAFNANPAGANSVRGFFFDNNAAAGTAATKLTDSATVVGAITTPLSIAACPEGATDETAPRDDAFFAFDGTPDAESLEGDDFTRVGVITVTIGTSL